MTHGFKSLPFQHSFLWTLLTWLGKIWFINTICACYTKLPCYFLLGAPDIPFSSVSWEIGECQCYPSVSYQALTIKSYHAVLHIFTWKHFTSHDECVWKLGLGMCLCVKPSYRRDHGHAPDCAWENWWSGAACINVLTIWANMIIQMFLIIWMIVFPDVLAKYPNGQNVVDHQM